LINIDLLIKAESKVTEIFYMVDGFTKEFDFTIKPRNIEKGNDKG